MVMPVGLVESREDWVMQHQEVVGVVLLSRRGEVERAGDDRLAVNDHHLVVRDGMNRVDAHRDPRMRQEVRFGIVLGALALIQDDLDRHPALLGLDERFGNRSRGKRVGLHKDGPLGLY